MGLDTGGGWPKGGEVMGEIGNTGGGITLICGFREPYFVLNEGHGYFCGETLTKKPRPSPQTIPLPDTSAPPPEMTI